MDSWLLVSASEERLLLHQFLRFDETRPIAQHLILQQALQMIHGSTPSYAVVRSHHQSRLGFLEALQLRQSLQFASVHSRNANVILDSYDRYFLHRDQRGGTSEHEVGSEDAGESTGRGVDGRGVGRSSDTGLCVRRQQTVRVTTDQDDRHHHDNEL